MIIPMTIMFLFQVPTVNISIRCEDSGRPVQSIEKWFVINVQDVNERPTSISLSNSFVAENTPPGGIGTSLNALYKSFSDKTHQVIPSN